LFLHWLATEQQIAFARLAMFMVHADGEVDERERVLLDELQQELGLIELPQVPSAELVSKDIGIIE
jgi:tellurite resistance protein